MLGTKGLSCSLRTLCFQLLLSLYISLQWQSQISQKNVLPKRDILLRFVLKFSSFVSQKLLYTGVILDVRHPHAMLFLIFLLYFLSPKSLNLHAV